MTRSEQEGPERRQGLSDASMDAVMGRLLQVGVLLASAMVLVGGVLYLRAKGAGLANYGSFRSEPGSLRHWAQVMRAIGRGDPAAIIQVGVLLLIATPVARVVLAAVAFTMQRDRLYVGISVAVLAILLVGLFWLG